MSDDRDPIEQVLGAHRDLYDIATWQERTALDRIAVWLERVLKRSARVLVIGSALVILVVQLALSGFAVVSSPLLGAFTILSIVPALILAAYIWYGDPTLREPPTLLVVTFLLGVLFAGFAAILNSTIGAVVQMVPVVGSVLFFYLVVGPVEEFVKWLAVRLYAFRSPGFHAVIDGAVYGAMAGLGFATIENAIYITRVYLEAAGTSGMQVLPATAGIAGVRGLAGPGHVIYAAFSGYYLGLAKFNPENAGPIVVKGLLIATLIHATYNTLVSSISLTLLTYIGFIVVFDGVLLVLLFRKLRRYRGAYHEALAASPTAGDPDGDGRSTLRDEPGT